MLHKIECHRPVLQSNLFLGCKLKEASQGEFIEINAITELVSANIKWQFKIRWRENGKWSFFWNKVIPPNASKCS